MDNPFKTKNKEGQWINSEEPQKDDQIIKRNKSASISIMIQNQDKDNESSIDEVKVNDQ